MGAGGKPPSLAVEPRGEEARHGAPFIPRPCPRPKVVLEAGEAGLRLPQRRRVAPVAAPLERPGDHIPAIAPFADGAVAFRSHALIPNRVTQAQRATVTRWLRTVTEP